jgi:hypothetical protein
MTYQEHLNEFNAARRTEDGEKIIEKCTAIINEVGKNFLDLDGGALAEHRSKLAGYLFYISDSLCDWQRIYKSIEIDIKTQRAELWDEITEKIKAEKGKVSNKEQIENEFNLVISWQQVESMLYETLYNKAKLKIGAIEHVLMAITQRIKELTAQEYDARQAGN